MARLLAALRYGRYRWVNATSVYGRGNSLNLIYVAFSHLGDILPADNWIIASTPEPNYPIRVLSIVTKRC